MTSTTRCSQPTLAALLRAVIDGDADGHPSPAFQLAAREDGMLTLTVGVVLLAFVVMFGLIGNVGRITKEKMEVQNAADAAAYSSALWMARGMNAVTASNHLLGELTALCVLHEAIGGALVDEGERGNPTAEMNLAHGLIQGLRGPATYADAAFMNKVASEVTSDKNGPTAGAMLYDARMQLKWYCVVALGAKALGTALTATGFGAGVGAALHVGGSLLLGKILMEWELLRFLEVAAKAIATSIKPLVYQAIEALAGYSGTVAGQGVAGVLGPAVKDALEQIAAGNGVQAVLYPPPLSLALPIVQEDAPRSGSGIPAIDTSDRGSIPPLLQQFTGAVSTAMNVANGLLRWINNDLVRLFLPGFIVDRIEELQARLDDLSQGFHHIAEGRGYPNNPSLDDLRELQADWNHESRSQWTRATYPYVDAFRVPFAQSLNNYLLGAPLANAATWYMQWTSRFAVARPVAFRQGQDDGRQLAMYVMRDSDRWRKGQEPWTTDSQLAERTFTVIAFARREVKTLVSPAAFGEPSPRELVAYGQAMFYNANPQEPGSGSGRQPPVGWDTLNWDPGWTAREFDHPTAPGNIGWKAPWDVLLKWEDAPRVKLNWQAKLVPVTQSRLQAAWLTLPSEYKQALKTAPLVSSSLDTH